VDYFYSAAEHRSRGALWPIFTPALIVDKLSAEIGIFDARLALNLQQIAGKVKEPSSIVTLESLAAVLKGEFDFLMEAETVYAPPPPKKKVAAKKAKQPTSIESTAKANSRARVQRASTSKKKIAA
jgi:hypothetical protein